MTVIPKPKPRKQRKSSGLGDIPPVPSGRQPPVPRRRSGRDRKRPDRLGDYVMYNMQSTGPYDTRTQATCEFRSIKFHGQ